LTTLEERFSNALHSTARSWKAAIDRRLKYLGVSQASWTTIAAIAKADAAMSQIELANKLGLEAATMVSMIDRLAKAGLVLREASSSDRRIKLIVLTEEGKQLFSKVKKEADIFRMELLSDIDAKKLLVATELLERLQRVTEAS
jgi:MarR family transcriptional regulator, transcriptional regulator for hemolysin